MRSGEANVARCEPPGYSYLAEQCVPRAKTTSKTSKLTTSNSASKNSLLEKSDQVNINLLG
jgi:hypothetical protein